MLDLFSASKISLGTVKFGRNQGVKYPHIFEIPSIDALANLIDLAHDLGINLLDTAPAYGNSEEKLGTLLKGKRDKWLISTKVGETFVDGQSSFDFTPTAIEASVKASLQRLQTNYLDSVLVHSDGKDVAILEQYDCFGTLNKLKQQGLIRYVGMSTKTYDGSMIALEQGDGAMIEYNLAQADAIREQQRQIIEYAQANNKFIFIKKAFNSGNIAGEIRISESLQLIYSTPGVTSTIVGTINPAHLKENINICKQVISDLKND